MIDILNLAVPYFGLIFIGFACGKAKGLPEAGPAWMNFFLLYVSPPALLFVIMSKTPFDDLNNPPFLVATRWGPSRLLSWPWRLAILQAACCCGKARLPVSPAPTAISVTWLPGLPSPVLGATAAAPTALIFCCDSIFLFSAVPLLIELSDRDHPSLLHAFGVVLRQIVLNPLIMSACAGAFAAAFHVHLPVAIDNTLLYLPNAAAPTALFVLGVTVALRPFKRVPCEVPGVIAIKLLIPPFAALGLMWLFGPFAQRWAATAVLMASLPPALNVFVIARQNETWIGPASVAVLIGTFASVVTLTSVMWMLQAGRLVFL